MSSATQKTVRDDYVDLTGFQRDILWKVSHLGGAAYGLKIKEELEAMGYGEVNHGRLYPNLDDLVRNGFIEKSELDKRTNEYALTDEANKLLSDRKSWERGDA